MKPNGQSAMHTARDGDTTTKYYVDVLFMKQLNEPYGYTYEVPEHFIRDLNNGQNLVVVEGRGGLLTLAYVVSRFKGNIQNERIKPIHDVCTRVRMKPSRVKVAETAKTSRGQLF